MGEGLVSDPLVSLTTSISETTVIYNLNRDIYHKSAQQPKLKFS